MNPKAFCHVAIQKWLFLLGLFVYETVHTHTHAHNKPVGQAALPDEPDRNIYIIYGITLRCLQIVWKKINKLPCNMISLTKHASPQYITATSICSWQRGNRGCQMENILCWASVYGYTQMPLNFSKTLSSVSTTLAHWQALSTGLYLHTFI